MTTHCNEHGQPIGDSLADWQPRPAPVARNMPGRYCQLEPLNPDRHGRALHRAFSLAGDSADWTYMPYGPFADAEAYVSWCHSVSHRQDPMFFAIVDRAFGSSAGVASYLRIQAELGVIEVGHIHFAPVLQKTAAATEAMYLLMRHALGDLAYRRYEWKCDALNAPSRRAAERLGFRFEGIFRQDRVYKGRNRDTAWYSITDLEWPSVRERLERWLEPENFDAEGRQRTALERVDSP